VGRVGSIFSQGNKGEEVEATSEGRSRKEGEEENHTSSHPEEGKRKACGQEESEPYQV